MVRKEVEEKIWFWMRRGTVEVAVAEKYCEREH
jgi:hypothetical protein